MVILWMKSGARSVMKAKRKLFIKTLLLAVVLAVLLVPGVQAATDTGSVGLEGKISAPPPSQAPTITVPGSGSTHTEMPITVSGLCPNGTIVKVFKNNVFAGAAECRNGSYSVRIDLFAGRNELVARAYDDLDQASPDSNKVIVTFPLSDVVVANRISLTSPFAKRGADPGKTLVWPIALTGGNGPYAITVDWGDGKTPDIISQEFAGNFSINHVYDNAGTYTIIVRASDRNGQVAFLQLIGVANGPAAQSSEGGEGDEGVITIVKILWQPVLACIPLIAAAFWLGKRHEVYTLRKRLERQSSLDT